MDVKSEFLLDKPSPQPFDYSNCLRNLALKEIEFLPKPKVVKTGTTIVAAAYKDGVVLGADKRATMGNIVSDKMCKKIHELTETIHACGAGGAADLAQVGRMLSANLRLHELNTGKPARVSMAISRAKQHLFQHQGYVQAYLIIGGVDISGVHLFSVSANGYSQRHQFISDGSGSYIANSILERDFKTNMTEEEACELVGRALTEGMKGDNASGNAYDIVVIRKDGKGTALKGPFIPDFCKRSPNVESDYTKKLVKTIILKEKTVPTIPYAIIDESVEKRGTETLMEIS